MGTEFSICVYVLYEAFESQIKSSSANSRWKRLLYLDLICWLPGSTASCANVSFLRRSVVLGICCIWFQQCYAKCIHDIIIFPSLLCACVCHVCMIMYSLIKNSPWLVTIITIFPPYVWFISCFSLSLPPPFLFCISLWHQSIECLLLFVFSIQAFFS